MRKRNVIFSENRIVSNYFFSWLNIFILFVLFSCKPKEEVEDILILSVTTIGATADANNYDIKVTTTVAEFSASVDVDWCSLGIDVAKKLIVVSIDKNTNNEIRKAKITVNAGKKTAIISITQVPDESSELIFTPTQLDSVSLLALNNGSKRWNSSQVMDTWEGIKVDVISGYRRVTEINLPENQYIVGNISDSIKNLTEIMYIDLTNCNLVGSMPSLQTLNNLVVLDLKKNQLTGIIPKLPSSLYYLSLGQNKFSGSLPISITDLPKLTILDLGLNDLTGEIPADWSTLTNMKYFYLYGNVLSGSIPSYITTFNKLEALALDYNQLTGTIPTGIGLLTSLKYLTLHYNKLTGKVPSDLLNNINWSVWYSTVVPQQNGNTLSAVKSKTDSDKVINFKDLPNNYTFYTYLKDKY